MLNMNSSVAWSQEISHQDGKPCRVAAMAYKPDGTELLVAAGNKIFVYKEDDGTLIQTLHGHKDEIFCVVYAATGERFATGSADKNVIIWTEQHEGVLKFSHNGSVQCLAFCPVSSALLSCATTDFGLWFADKKTVDKHKSQVRICSCSWAPNGEYFVLGLQNGTIMYCNKTGEEMLKVNRPGGNPVWYLAFSPYEPEETLYDKEGEFSDVVLVVLDWSPSISFYDINGQKILDDRKLDHDPLCLDFYLNGEFLIVSGSHGKVDLHTRTGNFLCTLANHESWVWACRTRPDGQCIAVGCEDGTVTVYQIQFNAVHGLFNDRYVYRHNITNVVVQHLMTGLKQKIRCDDLVKTVAVYKSKLAVQLTSAVQIYECDDSEKSMDYQLINTIHRDIPCPLLILCSRHVVFCKEKSLHSYNFSGRLERQWSLESAIRYIRVVGGCPGQESLLLGLQTGLVQKIFLDNPFPWELLRLNSAIVCLDLSLSQRKLAAVTENNTCLAYDLITEQVLFQESHVNSVAWNRLHEDLICMSGKEKLIIQMQHFKPFELEISGIVVGFSGSQVFCLNTYTVCTIEIPLDYHIRQVVESGHLEFAYSIACLGTFASEWDYIGSAALKALDFDLAKRAYQRTKRYKKLNLIERVQAMPEKEMASAMVQACTGDIESAATAFNAHGFAEKTVEMYLDLHMFDKINSLLGMLGLSGKRNLMRKQAFLAYQSKNYTTSCDLYVAAEEYGEAINIMAEHHWSDRLISLARNLSDDNEELLVKIARALEADGQYALAAEVYRKLRDLESQIRMQVANEDWQQAFYTAKQVPELENKLYLQYANILIERDQFEEACNAYRKAGCLQQSLYVLQQLAEIAVDENRFSDAGYFYWLLSMENIAKRNKEEFSLQDFQKLQDMATIYHAYNFIYRYVEEPFTFLSAETLLNISRFVINCLQKLKCKKVSEIRAYFTMARQGMELGAFKLTRMACDRLNRLDVPEKLKIATDTLTLSVRSKPFQDPEEMLPVCYACSMANPMLTDSPNKCVHCGAAIVYSSITFEVLPLRELTSGDETSESEADNTESEAAASEVLKCEWPSPIKTKYFKNLMPEVSISLCKWCNRFFHTEDYEFAVLQSNRCPFCRQLLDLKNDE